MVHELPPLHHIVGVQLTGGVHVGYNVDADLRWGEGNLMSFAEKNCVDD